MDKEHLENRSRIIHEKAEANAEQAKRVRARETALKGLADEQLREEAAKAYEEAKSAAETLMKAKPQDALGEVTSDSPPYRQARYIHLGAMGTYHLMYEAKQQSEGYRLSQLKPNRVEDRDAVEVHPSQIADHLADVETGWRAPSFLEEIAHKEQRKSAIFYGARNQEAAETLKAVCEAAGVSVEPVAEPAPAA